MSCSVVPRRAATLPSIPFTLIGAGLASDLDEPVSIAKTDAPWGSPTKRIPSGPKASAPADFRSGLPFCNPLVTSAAWSTAALTAAVNSTVKDKRIALGIVRSFRKKVNNRVAKDSDGEENLRYVMRESPGETSNARDGVEITS